MVVIVSTGKSVSPFTCSVNLIQRAIEDRSLVETVGLTGMTVITALSACLTRTAVTFSIGHPNFERGSILNKLITISLIYNLIFRTSPVLVPQAAARNSNCYRQRQESTSSLSVGSWQMISGTGSLRSQESHIVVINEQQHLTTNHYNNNINLINSVNPSSHPLSSLCSNNQSTNGGSSSMAVHGSTETSTLIDEDCFTANDYFMRRERLNAVRTLFYNCYSSTIGYKFKNGADSATLGSLLGNFAEKVGLTQRTPV